MTDFRRDYVEPDTPAGDLGHLRRRGEAGSRDKCEYLGVAQQIVIGDESGCESALEHPVHIDTAAVVAPRITTDDRSRAAESVSFATAAFPETLRSAGVSTPWSSELRGDASPGSPISSSRLVDFDVRAKNLEHDFLAEGMRRIAHHSLEPLERLSTGTIRAVVISV